MPDILIRGGTVVDGTGADARRADVRVRDGVIAEVAPDLAPDGEPLVDASGAYVTPGIIDTHTHLDGAMWWNPALDPLPSYGNTSMVFGNCGNSIAPLAGAQRDEIVDLLCFLEDLPLEAFRREVPWTWEQWPEYADALTGQPTTVHVGGYVGHLAVRTYVMGEDAWTRAATSDEVARMVSLLDDGLQAGAMGLSVNHFDKDRALRPVPGYFADDDEYRALFAVVARHHPATVQMITRFNDPEHDVEDAERFGRLCRDADVRAQWPGMPMNVRDRRASTGVVGHPPPSAGERQRLLARGAVQAAGTVLRLRALDRVPARPGLERAGERPRRRQVADPRRSRAGATAPGRTGMPAPARLSPGSTARTRCCSPSPRPAPARSTARWRTTPPRRGLHISDALAEWVLANGIRSIMVGTPEELAENDIVTALREPRTISNINDSGAHLQLFSGAGEHLYLLTHYVRDRQLLGIEEAVHVLTGRTAAFFGLADRGVIAPGRIGDLAVFALDEIELQREERRYDVPHGTWRFTRPPAGVRATVVAGTPTWLDGSDTGARPGGFLRPG